ncbi:hypothetical protein [Hymenobacter metallicola]|uniref:Uncharacterized protein n=1 Tax=Hymenobacter metallicola TaxID=2563114 RepID=A0A4Z0QKM3_9BACT|nr:hypothetical protein [Hymenobacter metallicola]TGE29809.1 hypothetical protein E5K02_10220 [Hymenobacter metallicola]
MQTRQLFTLDTVLRKFLQKMGDAPAHYYAQMLPHVFDFWVGYVSDTGRENRTVELAILPDRTAVLPDDYDNYVMVGVRNGDYVRNLTYNGSLTNLPPSYEPFLQGSLAEEVVAVPEAEGVVPRVGLRHAYLGWPGGELYGEGYPGYGQEFKIDGPGRRIICSTEVPQDRTLILQYHAFSTVGNEGWVINPLWDKPLSLYLTWQFYLYVKKDLGAAREFERLYHKAKDKAEDRSSTFSITDAYAAQANHARGIFR